jgi:AcrR family transcriptional regulator
MKGLRAKQKADRHDLILRKAAELFRSYGYDDVKMEAIAAAAEMSIGTIYNYYQNKGDILVAIVAMEVNEVRSAGERVVALPPRSAGKAIDKLISTYIEHSLVYLSKAMWRQAMAIAIQQPDSPSGQNYSKLDAALADQICLLIDKLKLLGLVRTDVDARGLGEILFNSSNTMFIFFVKDEKKTIAQVLAHIRRQNRSLIKLISTEGASEQQMLS